MSQMKPYCFKCGAELDPEAIYCPVCGRLQRSMVVRTVEPGAKAAPGQPYQEGYGQPTEPHREQVPESGQVDSGFHPQYGGPERWPAADQQAAHEDQHQPYGDQRQPYGDQRQTYGEQPPYGDQQEPYGDQQQPYAEPQPYGEQPYGEQPPYGDQQQPYGEQPYGQGQPYAEQQQPYGEEQQPYAEQRYGEQPPYGEQPYAEQPYAEQPPYGQHQPYADDQPYGQHQPYGEQPPYADERQPYGELQHGYPGPAGEPPTPGQDEPAVQDPYASSEWYKPTIEEARPGPAVEPPVRRWDDPEPPPGGTAAEADHVYASGSFPRPGYREPVDPIASRYDYGAQGYPGRDMPYAPPYSTPVPGYRSPAAPPDYGNGQPAGGRNWMRLAALAAAALLGLFLVGFGIGQVFLGSSPSQVSTVTQPTPRQATQAPAPTATPGAPTPTLAPTPLVGGTANFLKVGATIPAGCTTRQGCPVAVTLRNTGGQGGGTVTVTLTDEAHNPIATFTGPIPVTEAGQTVQVTGYATGDQLGAYLRSGGTVYVSTIDVQNNA
jgi:hypothetical protein